MGNGAGSPRARIFSNTVVGNGDRGLTIGTSNAASPNAVMRNNILQSNGTRSSPALENIKVFTQSEPGYNGDFNLVSPPTYLPARISGDHDIAADAAFEFAGGSDFHLRTESPALNAGDMLPREFEAILYARTTTAAGNADTGRLDLGFHYPP